MHVSNDSRNTIIDHFSLATVSRPSSASALGGRVGRNLNDIKKLNVSNGLEKWNVVVIIFFLLPS